MLLPELACAPGVAAPDADALLLPDGRWSRAELGDAVAAMVGPLTTLAPPGGCIALAADNRPEVLALLLAIPSAGRVAVPIDTRLVPDEMVAQIDATGAGAIIGTAEALGRLAPVLAPTTGRTLVGLDPGAGDISLTTLVTAPAPSPPTGDDDTVTAWILFADGRGPVAARREVTAQHLGAAVASLEEDHPLADDDVHLHSLPLGHAAVTNVLRALHRGRPVVLPPRFDAGTVVELASRHGATTLALAPTMLRALLDHRSAVGPAAMPSELRSITCTTAAAPALLDEARSVLGIEVRVVDALGLIPGGGPVADR